MMHTELGKLLVKSGKDEEMKDLDLTERTSQSSIEKYQAQGPFKIGKLRSKYLILEILQFLSRKDGRKYLWNTSNRSRLYSLNYNKFLQKLTHDPIILDIDLCKGTNNLVQPFLKLHDKNCNTFNIKTNIIRTFNKFCQSLQSFKKPLFFNRVVITKQSPDDYQEIQALYDNLKLYKVQSIDIPSIPEQKPTNIGQLRYLREITLSKWDKNILADLKELKQFTTINLVVEESNFYRKDFFTALPQNLEILKIQIAFDQSKGGTNFIGLLHQKKVFPKCLVVDKLELKNHQRVQDIVKYNQMKNVQVLFDEDSQEEASLEVTDKNQLEDIQVLSNYARRLKVHIISGLNTIFTIKQSEKLLSNISKQSYLRKLTVNFRNTMVNSNQFITLLLMNPNLIELHIQGSLQIISSENFTLKELTQKEPPRIRTLTIDEATEIHLKLFQYLYQKQGLFLKKLKLKMNRNSQEKQVFPEYFDLIHQESLESLELDLLTYSTAIQDYGLLEKFKNLKELTINIHMLPENITLLCEQFLKTAYSLEILRLSIPFKLQVRNDSINMLCDVIQNGLPNLKELDFMETLKPQNNNPYAFNILLEIAQRKKTPLKIVTRATIRFDTYVKLRQDFPRHQFAFAIIWLPNEADILRNKQTDFQQLFDYLKKVDRIDQSEAINSQSVFQF